MRVVFGWVICVFLLAFCGSKKIEDGGWDITVKGKVKFPDQGSITIRELKRDNTGRVDTIKLDANNAYEKKVHLVEPGYYQLNFFNKQILNVILNKSNVEVNVDGNEMQGAMEVIGSPEHDLIAKVQNMMTAVQSSPELVSIEQQFQAAAQAHDDAKVEVFREQYLTIFKKGQDQVAALLLQEPASLATVDLLQQGNLLDKDAYFNVYEDAADKLKKDIPNSPIVKDFVSQVEKSKSTSIGKEAPEIALPNPAGVVVKLSSLRGKYVLVDFWAKWCGPCRRENPNVVKAYQKYKSKGFEVYGVSLDRSKEDWVQAIQQDGLTWTHVSDLKYFDSEAAKIYNINAIPFSILLDKKGVIIAKNLRGAALEKKLSEVMKD